MKEKNIYIPDKIALDWKLQKDCVRQKSHTTGNTATGTLCCVNYEQSSLSAFSAHWSGVGTTVVRSASNSILTPYLSLKEEKLLKRNHCCLTLFKESECDNIHSLGGNKINMDKLYWGLLFALDTIKTLWLCGRGGYKKATNNHLFHYQLFIETLHGFNK